MNVREKLKKLYDLVQDNGLYIAPENNIHFGSRNQIALNINNSEELIISSESYNATILFSLFTGIRRRGTQIFFGPPGAGKTTLAELIGHFLYGKKVEEVQNATIYGHPEQTESSMIARLDTGRLIQGEERVLPRPFLQSPVKIIDEINRLPPGKLSILYQLVDRGFVNYLSERIVATEGPLFATANSPDSGNYALPFPLLDRFDIAVLASELNPFFIEALMIKGDGNAQNKYELKLQLPEGLPLAKEELECARTEIEKITITPEGFYFLTTFLSTTNYCSLAGEDLSQKLKGLAFIKKPSELCANCHFNKQTCSFTANGLSPRTYSAILAHAKTLAWYRGNTSASINDLEQVIPYAVWHKLQPTRAAIDNNAMFENDRIAFARYLIAEAKKDFIKYKKHFESYDRILQAAEQKKDIEQNVKNALENVKKIDTVLRYPLAITLGGLLEKEDNKTVQKAAIEKHRSSDSITNTAQEIEVS